MESIGAIRRTQRITNKREYRTAKAAGKNKQDSKRIDVHREDNDRYLRRKQDESVYAKHLGSTAKADEMDDDDMRSGTRGDR